jgi:hypothetical protein
MTRERLAVSGLAALITAISAALLSAARTPTEVGLCGLVATLALAAFAIALGDD